MSKQAQRPQGMPPAPPLRVFEVTLDSYGDPVKETIKAHSFDESPTGSLMFIEAVPLGEIYVKRIVRYFRAGEVVSMTETTDYEPKLISLVVN